MNMTTLDPLVVRQSDLGTLCPASKDPALVAADGYDDSPSEPAGFGSFVHALIARDLHALRHGGPTPMDDTDLTVVAIDTLKEGDDADLGDFLDAQGIASYVDEGRNALELWRTWFNEDGGIAAARSVQIENRRQRTIGDLGGREVILQGTPDLIWDGMGYDWKTSKNGWKEGQFKADTAAQLSLYTHLEHGDASLMPEFEGMHWNYSVYTRKKGGSWDNYPALRYAPQIRTSLLTIGQHAITVQAGGYVPVQTQTVFGKTQRAWWCTPKWCPAWNVCPYKDIGDLSADALDIQRKVVW